MSISSVISNLTGKKQAGFKFRFDNGEAGLDSLVRMAVSAEPGEYIIGSCQGGLPLEQIEVRMYVTEDGRYTLLAKLVKRDYGAQLPFNAKGLKQQNFHVTASDALYAILRTTTVPGIFRYSSINPNHASVKYEANANEMTSTDVEKSIRSFAGILQIIASGMSQNGTLTLAESKDPILQVSTEAERISARMNRYRNNKR